MDDPQITAVIPTYRRPMLLRRAIESVLGQTWRPLTVLVLDNASGDETPDVVAAIARRDPRLRYHCHTTNVGSVMNFQAGMDAVQTPYFSFLSDDDILLPSFYERALSCLRENPGAKFFCGQTVRYDPAMGSHRLRPTKNWRNGLYEAGEATVRMVQEIFLWTGAVFSADIRARAGPLEATIDFCDVLFMSKAAAQFPFVVSLEPCAVFTAWTENASRNISSDRIARSFRLIAERLADLPTVSNSEARLIAELLERNLRTLMRARLRSPHLIGDWETFRQAVAVLARHGDLDFKTTFRLLRKIIRRFPRLRLFPKVRGGLGRSGPTIEEVVRIYSTASHI